MVVCWKVALLCLSLAALCTARSGRNAYITIHYEGTSADDEYILGIRVLMQSLQPLKHPFLILISDNVSQKSRDLFTSEGATLIPVENIKNPFSHVQHRFSFSLNKLHLWNLTEYDRLIYFDADNIAVHREMVDDLFLCGHFCVVYMNPCHFHTGVMVIKPNRTVFEDLLASIAHTGSYDGADQGFLSEYFSAGCNEAPIFNAAQGQSEARYNQLHVAYNMHALYHFVRGDLDVYRCGPARGYTDEFPVATLGFPVPPIIKPWYYWTPLMGHARMWHLAREPLPEPELFQTFCVRLLAVIIIYAIARTLLTRVLHAEHPRLAPVRRWVQHCGPYMSAGVFGVGLLLLANRLGQAVTPAIARPYMGFTLYFVTHVAFIVVSARLVANLFFNLLSTGPIHNIPMRDIAYVMLSLLILFSMHLWRPFFELFMGYGLHTVIICFVLAAAAVVGSHLYLFLHVARRSPLFHHLHE